MYLEGLVWFLLASPNAAGIVKGSQTGMATGHEGDPNWTAPPTWELLATMVTNALLSPAALGVLQLHTRSIAVVKQGTYIYTKAEHT